MEDKKSGTKVDTWTEEEYMKSNFKSILNDHKGYDKSITDDIDLYARTVLNTNGASKCADINTKELESTAIQLNEFVDSTQSRFKTMYIVFGVIIGGWCAMLFSSFYCIC